MKIVNFGSLNIDRVYKVTHLVRPGETLTSSDYAIFAGGKGLNQSIALARAGAEVYHAGKIGEDGRFLQDLLRENGVDVSMIFTTPDPTGHAVIQVEEGGENAIILFGGANQMIQEDEIAEVFRQLTAGDYLLLQNEINNLPSIIDMAIDRGVQVILNPAPITADIVKLPLEKIHWLVVNEVEAEMITGETRPAKILDALVERYPTLGVLLTLGSSGAWYAKEGVRVFTAAETVEPIDTTGAGDTFIGYFVAEIVKSTSVEEAMATAGRAAAICVTRNGAADSIPVRSEL